MAEARSLKLSDSKRAYLASVTRARTMHAQTVRRARTLTRKTGGESVDTETEKLDLNHNRVLLWSPTTQDGVENALKDAPGRDRNSKNPDEDKAWVMDAA